MNKKKIMKDSRRQVKLNKTRGFLKKFLSIVMKSRTIRVKLIISFIIPIIFIVVLGAVSFYKAASGIRSSYETSTAHSITMSAEYLNIGVKSAESFAEQSIGDNSLKRYLTGYYKSDLVEYYKLTQNLMAKTASDEFISNINILSDQVKSVSVTKLKGNILNDFYNTELGKQIKNNSVVTAWSGSNKVLDEKLGKDYALRYIRNITGINAVIVIDIRKEVVLNNLKALELDKLGEVGLVVSDKTEIIFGNDSNTKAVFTNQDFYKTALASDQTSSSCYVNKDGKKYLFLYAKIGDSGAMLCALLPKNVIMGQADSIKKITIVIVIFAIIVAALIGSIISISIDKTIKNINKDLGKAAGGDLTVQFNSKRKDEFHILIEEIQRTFHNMKELIRKVQVLSNEVSDSSSNVAKTSQAFMLSSQSISQAMNEIEKGINQQAKDAEECLKHMDELSGKIELVSDNTKEIEKLAVDTQSSIRKGTKATLDLNNQTKTTLEIADEIIKEIEELAVKSSSVGKIVNAINEIVNQTNLLSLNASIEAARAGEHGRGFAVVAEEIRKLSEKSGNSVQDINRIIKTIEEGITKVSKTAKKVESVMILQDSAVENTTNSYHKINENVEKLVVNLNDISSNIDNIGNARVSTLGAIESISAVLEEIAASSNSVNQTTKELLSAVGSLNIETDSLNEESNQLVEAVDIFTI